MKKLNKKQLTQHINELVEEYYEDYIQTPTRKKIFVDQVYDTALGTCETLDDVTTLIDGILIGWFMDREQDYTIYKRIFK